MIAFLCSQFFMWKIVITVFCSIFLLHLCQHQTIKCSELHKGYIQIQSSSVVIIFPSEDKTRKKPEEVYSQCQRNAKLDKPSQIHSTNQQIAQFRSVAQLCPTLWDHMNCSTPGLPVHHQLPEFTQTHFHRVGDAIQSSISSSVVPFSSCPTF